MSATKLQPLKVEAAEARLAALTLPEGAGWATEARKAALSRVAAMGLPHRRDEYWKYTDPASLVAAEAPKAALFHNDEGPLFDAIDRVKIVFVDGVFDAAASDDLTLTGVEIERLSDACTKDIHWAKDIYGVLEARNAQSKVDRPLAALNTAFAADGVVIRATGKASKPINLIYLHKSESSDAMLHHLVRVEVGADLTLLETGPAAARFSKVMEVDVADGGAFHHVRAQGRDHERRAVTGTYARLGKESTFKSFTMTFNGVLTRNETLVELTGDDAVAHVAGACVGDGKDFHHDDTVFVTHDAVNCESRQVFKKVLRNGATGVFQAKILVQPGAQKTDGYQISQSLLLDEDSQFLAKPELEIYADDVACSHGSTSGAIDEEALFYLRSRGVPVAEATDLLTLSFLGEALEEIEDERLAQDMLDRLSGWLSRRR
ncbi:SufD family Fe-S cluster assembly protein [Loktanella sp. IMCC34160]|uniref:SufB/SufD family protein n=1 Tax=Loktanella sp. IMCC34160 TaxID=2510646 RepID=UPI00101DB312|nr:SufD family Fe-S cluster assembly protein [Loktanella sp. IMCC34160]RYG90987.1 SufD family Fe-S cluster assembly protein [Loktanella sp. IMCC34160]